jgi:hypothetical protein
MILRPQGIMGVKELWETSLWRRQMAKLRGKLRSLPIAKARKPDK